MKWLFKLMTLLTMLAAGPAFAQGWYGDGWGGGGWGGGYAGFGYVPPPVYYVPPPVIVVPPQPVAPPAGYYAPYPGYIAQVPAAARTPAQSCDAGTYTCPLEASVPVGGKCYCPGNDGNRVYGAAR